MKNSGAMLRAGEIARYSVSGARCDQCDRIKAGSWSFGR